MKFRYSSEALADLVSIIEDGIAKFGAKRSASYVTQLKTSMSLLLENPKMSRLRDDLPRPMRIHPVGAHLIVYEFTENEFVIVRILPSRSDIVRHFNA